MAKRYRLWPCRNRPREGPENLAKIETRAMGFLATPKARPGHSLASASDGREQIDDAGNKMIDDEISAVPGAFRDWVLSVL